MTLENEIEVYDKAKVSSDAGEIELWDQIIFPVVIRKRQIQLIIDAIEQAKPRKILDFGCGAGWISKILSSKGYDVTGIDASSWLIKNAMKASHETHFLVGDCMALPFKENVFDFVIGMGILHHLDANKALAECFRVSNINATVLFMEPNELNPLAALGRKFMPADTYSKNQKPFTPRGFKMAFKKQGWALKYFGYFFPYSFSIAYLLRKVRNRKVLNFLKFIAPLITVSEKKIERIRLLNQLSWTLVVIAKKLPGMEKEFGENQEDYSCGQI